ncbi:MAG: MoaD/ThiS family protein [Bryobacterales bacterium]|jgi:molybdopterin converting factor small subunit|nr:MoaD/ThiS family protein [Bryobacterales bacterium]
MTHISIPTPLRQFTNGLDSVAVEGATVGELLDALTAQFPGLKGHLFNDEGKLRSFVNVYLNDEDIRYLQKTASPVKDGDSITIIPSIAGGTSGFGAGRTGIARVKASVVGVSPSR